jgi:fluoride exporter
MTALLVVAGAVIGAPLRYITDRAVQRRHDSVFPWGTLAVNVAGSLVLGFVAGAAARGVSPHVLALVGTGFCGALTTYSTFSYESVRLVQQGARFFAVANIAVSVVAGLGAAFCGVAVAEAIWH